MAPYGALMAAPRASRSSSRSRVTSATIFDNLTDRADEGTATAFGLKKTREDEQEVYRRCKTARQTDLRAMLAGPKGREVGESGELDKAVRKGEGERWVLSASLPLLAQEDL
eukprot:7441714-Pyramimonas_sp.AAC.2